MLWAGVCVLVLLALLFFVFSSPTQAPHTAAHTLTQWTLHRPMGRQALRYTDCCTILNSLLTQGSFCLEKGRERQAAASSIGRRQHTQGPRNTSAKGQRWGIHCTSPQLGSAQPSQPSFPCHQPTLHWVSSLPISSGFLYSFNTHGNDFTSPFCLLRPLTFNLPVTCSRMNDLCLLLAHSLPELVKVPQITHLQKVLNTFHQWQILLAVKHL